MEAADVTLASDRNGMIAESRGVAEDLTGQRFLWPATPDGPGLPCTASPLTNSARLNPEGGGTSLFDDVIVNVRKELFLRPNGTYRVPGEQEGCQFKAGPTESWRHMKIDMVTYPPGAAVIQFHVNAYSQGA